MVSVLSKSGKVLDPCENVVARLLLKQKKAKVMKSQSGQFQIKMLVETTEYIHPMIHAIDTGSSKFGSAVVTETGNLVYLAEVEVRNDITEKMTRRATNRRNRRNRKTRYRKPRFDNRGNSKRIGRLSPTIRSKIDSHEKEIRTVSKLFPIGRLIIETASFDAHALKNPEVLINKDLYQKGNLYGYANMRAYILERDGYKCQVPGCKTKHKVIDVHHIIYRSNGGLMRRKILLLLDVSATMPFMMDQLH